MCVYEVGETDDVQIVRRLLGVHTLLGVLANPVEAVKDRVKALDQRYGKFRGVIGPWEVSACFLKHGDDVLRAIVPPIFDTTEDVSVRNVEQDILSA